jgi:hypothetical protein
MKLRALSKTAAPGIVMLLTLANTAPAHRASAAGSAPSSDYAAALISPVTPAGPASNNISTRAAQGAMVMGAVSVLKLSGSVLKGAGFSGNSSTVLAISVSGLRPSSTHHVALYNNCAQYLSSVTGSKGGQYAGNSGAFGAVGTYCAGLYGGNKSGMGGQSNSKTGPALGSTCFSTMTGRNTGKGKTNGQSSSATSGKSVTTLPDLHANAQGDATLITALSGSTTYTRGYELHIYAGSAASALIGCGALHAPTQVVQITGMHGNTAGAFALITTPATVLNGQVKDGTEVVVFGTGLQKGQAQPNHIHLGSCAVTGPVLFPLLTLVGDGQGRAVAGTAIPYAASLSDDSIHIHNSAYAMEACGNLKA